MFMISFLFLFYLNFNFLNVLKFFADKIILLLLYCLLCNVGLRQQNLSHLNKTHKKEKIIENKINLYSTLKNKFRYIQKHNLDKNTN